MSSTRNLVVSLAIACFSVASPATAREKAQGRAAVSHALEQPKVSTPISQVELVTTLRDAHVQQYGFEPSRSRLAMAWAQVALENANGQVMWNHNIGNIGPKKKDAWYRHSSLTVYRMNRLYVYALTKVLPNEERARKEKQATKDWEQYQSLLAFTPVCGCSSGELRSSHR